MAIAKKKIATTTKINDTQSRKSFEYIIRNLKRHSTIINVELSEIKRNIFEKSKEV